MSHNSANYQQNYQNYYQNTSQEYQEYYEDENQDMKENYDEAPLDLQVPNARLYAEGYPDVTELYTRNAPFVESQQQVENNSMQYRQDYTPGHNDYYYNISQTQHPRRTRVPKPQITPVQGTASYRYTHHHSLYPSCPLATSHSLQGTTLNPEESSYVPKEELNPLQGVGRNTVPFQDKGEYYTTERYDDNQEVHEDFDLSQRKIYQTQGNYGDYCAGFRQGFNIAEYGTNQEMYIDYKGKRFNFYGNRMGKGGVLRKYPVTVKTPKYITKNQVTSPINKKPSALCLPVVTQPDPGMVKRKIKTSHHLKRTYDQSEPQPQNPIDTTEKYSYPAHQMHSEGDMNPKSMVQGLDTLLDQYESKVVLNDNPDTGHGEGGNSETTENPIKQFSKFLKPRVPSTIKAKQERMAKMKASLNTSGVSLQPKMKLSLDKLLNRLQKCEKSESGEKLSEKSYQSKDEREKNEGRKSKGREEKKLQQKSFNYENISRKLSPRTEDKEEDEKSKNILHEQSTSLTTSLDNKKSSRLIRPLDDNCALDLHRSKSYIVDLIDRALSKELGTVPREQSIKHDMTPKRAVATISRHRESRHKELCYEVTAALTDSFISNATAPEKRNVDRDLRQDESNDKLCKSFSDDANYIKQLKQLRWGHIRHIQHEARKLADLEEFLEKCGEIEY